jgi:nickel superoxide dismutase
VQRRHHRTVLNKKPFYRDDLSPSGMRRHDAKASLVGVNGIKNGATRPSKETNMLGRLFASATPAHAHCDLYCGVYDPAQAKIEALSVVKTAQKYHESDDAVFQDRCIFIKEQRAEECKHHLMVLWADFFAPAHFDEFPQLHELFWKAVHQAGEAKKSMDPAVGEQLVSYIDEIAEIFWKTDKGQQMGVYSPA